MSCSDIGITQTYYTDDEIIDTTKLFQGQLLRMDETPEDFNWKLTPLYRETLDGVFMVWEIGYEHIDNRYKIIQGTLIDKDGVNDNLNINYIQHETDDSLKNARKMYIDKYNEGYFPPGNDLTVGLQGDKPMTAKFYCPISFQGKMKSNQTKIKNWPISITRKIKGSRCIASLKLNKISLSPVKKSYISKMNLKELYNFMGYLPRCELDGVCHKNKYIIFDIIEPDKMVWEKRYNLLVNAFIKYLEDGNTSNTFNITQSYTVNNLDELEKYNTMFKTEGYNGTMIRRYSYAESDKRMSQYRSNKNNSLVEYN